MNKNLILTDFKPILLGKLIDQNLLNQYTKFLYYKFNKEAKKAVMITDLDETQFSYDFISQQVEKYAVNAQHINQRQILLFQEMESFIIDDMKSSSISDYPLPQNFSEKENIVTGPKIETRMEWYKQKMKAVFDVFYSDKTQGPENIIHVSCSGYASPSIAQKAMAERNWLESIVTHSYQMGCYGAFPAIRTANGLLSSSNTGGRVDIVHTELLSAHLNLTEFSPSNTMICSLFADGFIGYSLYEEEEFKNTEKLTNQSGLKILAMHEVMIEDSLEDMTWDLGEYNFLMTLSKRVPVFIRKNIKPFLTDLCNKVNISLEDDKYNMLFAIHPGGPKIIDYIIEELELFEDQASWSYNILKKQGNMSSATIPHIFHDMLLDDTIAKGTKIIAMAFGPGLTATSLLVEKI